MLPTDPRSLFLEGGSFPISIGDTVVEESPSSSSGTATPRILLLFLPPSIFHKLRGETPPPFSSLSPPHLSQRTLLFPAHAHAVMRPGRLCMHAKCIPPPPLFLPAAGRTLEATTCGVKKLGDAKKFESRIHIYMQACSIYSVLLMLLPLVCFLKKKCC